MKLRYFSLLSLLLLGQRVAAQAPVLTLDEVIAQAVNHSATGQQAVTTRETSYWAWRGYQANYRPQLGLTGTVPNFNRVITPVVQPDGTTSFESVRINNSDLGLTVSQNIGLTGGQVYVGSVVQRFDDFNGGLRRYNNQPFTIGITQPLGQFNGLRWARAIEPLRYQESQRQYVEERETIAQRVTELYFDVLLQQVNAAVARQNAQATAELLRIGPGAVSAGPALASDLLQLELNVLDAARPNPGPARRPERRRGFAGLHRPARHRGARLGRARAGPAAGRAARAGPGASPPEPQHHAGLPAPAAGGRAHRGAGARHHRLPGRAHGQPGLREPGGDAGQYLPQPAKSATGAPSLQPAAGGLGPPPVHHQNRGADPRPNPAQRGAGRTKLRANRADAGQPGGGPARAAAPGRPGRFAGPAPLRHCPRHLPVGPHQPHGLTLASAAKDGARRGYISRCAPAGWPSIACGR